MSQDEAIGITLYVDGGTRPNPGCGGYGIHGYHYKWQTPVKGNGKSFLTTSQGYVDKSSNGILTTKDIEVDLASYNHIVHVTPTLYVDITGSIPSVSTNNTAEIIAMTQAFKYISKYSNLKYVQIFTDSEYTKNGTNEWVDIWDSKNWFKNDGNPVSNKELWIKLKEVRDVLLAKGISVNVEWIKGHNGSEGNEKADTLATIGVFNSQRGIVGETVKELEPETYWKNTVTRHPFISHKRCYFTSKSNIEPGVYHLGDHGKDDELLGKKSGDGCYSVVKLSEPELILDLIRNYQSGLTGSSDSIFAIYLDQVYNLDMYNLISTFGGSGFEPPNGYRLDIKHANKALITREFKPPRLATRSIEELNALEVILENFKSNSPDLFVHDITDSFYDSIEKKIPPKKGTSVGTIEISKKLKNTISVGCNELTVKCKVPLFKEVVLEDLKLTLGIDTISRNSLKHLESMNPSVYIVTWAVSDVSYRYATIIKAGNDIGIWCGVYSNLKINPIK